MTAATGTTPQEARARPARGADQESIGVVLGLTAAVLAVFAVIARFSFSSLVLVETSYRQWSIALEMLTAPRTLVLLVVLAIPLVLARGRLRWSRFEDDGIVRWIVLTCAGVIALAYSTYDYNLYFDRGHYLDRVLLVALAIWIWRTPIAVLPFSLLAIAVTSQFELPLGTSWTDKRLLYSVLLLFLSWSLVRAVTWVRASSFVWLALAMTATWYVVPAIGKITSGWLFRDRLENLFLASHANGWLASASSELVGRISDAIALLNPMLVTVTVAVELGAVLLVVRRNWARLFLIAAVGLHLSIFLSSGIFFWKWICLDLAFLAALTWGKREFLAEVFRPRMWIAGFALIGVTTVVAYSQSLSRFDVFDPAVLSWYDSPLVERYELEAVGRSGQRYRVGRNDMKPYDITFAQNRFSYLNPLPTLSGTYGAVTDAGILDELDALSGPEDVPALVQARGTVEYDDGASERFDSFIEHYFSSANRHGGTPFSWRWATAPQHISSTADEQPTYEGQEPVETIEVRAITELILDGELHPVSDRVIRTIAIPNTG